MWNFLITNILLFQGSTSADYICDKDPTSYCGKEMLTSEIPNNKHDLATMCSGYVKYIDCLQLHEALCPDEYIIAFFTPGDSSIMYKLIKEMCQNDSKLHIELADHISCIETTRNTSVDDCTLASMSTSDDYFAFLREELKTGGLDLDTIFDDFFVLPPCLWLSYTSSCTIHEIENSCGPLASAVAMEILQRSSILRQSCKNEDFAKLRKGFVDFLKPSNESEILQKIISSPEFFNVHVLIQLQEW